MTYEACVCAARVGELINNRKVVCNKWVLNFCKYNVVAREM